MQRASRLPLKIVLCALAFGRLCSDIRADEGPTSAEGPQAGHIASNPGDEFPRSAGPIRAATADSNDSEADGNAIRLVQETSPAPLSPAPEPFLPSPTAPPAARSLAASVFGSRDVALSLLSQTRRSRARGAAVDVILGEESLFRATTDAGSLLGKSPSATGVISKERSPIITNPRVRGSQVGQLLASGSYWFPARPDLDTLLSKIDSRIIQNMIVFKGPYSARYGPAFNFIDVDLLPSPRFANGYETHGSTSLEYKTNGAQFYGRQTVWGGDADWGFRVGYGHRTGSDYEAGNGTKFPSSYKSRDFDVALGYDPSPDSRIEFNYLRLDQTDVEVPTQLLDIEFLVTDAYELKYVLVNQEHFDRLGLDVWYNATRTKGNANSPGKQRVIPFLAVNNITETADAKNSSTGYNLALSWGDADRAELTLGTDLRYLTQQANAFVLFPGQTIPFIDGNNATPEINLPIPPAHWANPGLFAELTKRVSDPLFVRAGARLDFVNANAARRVNEADGAGGPGAGFGPNGEFPFNYNPTGQNENILLPDGTIIPNVPSQPVDIADLLNGNLNQNFALGAFFLTGEYALDDHWTATGGFGFAMRAPTMAELYPLQYTATVLPQQSFSVLFGNPNLKAERRYQIDLGLNRSNSRLRGGVNGFFAWIENYITYDSLIPTAFFYQYTNTDLATLAGFDMYAEYDVASCLTAFGTAKYVEGRDLSRNSNGLFGFTMNTTRSEITNRDHEPLPAIPPLEGRVGLRLHPAGPRQNWGVEFSSRIVNHQYQIATSLNELPTPGFTTYDIRGYWKPTQAWTLIVGFENLTDKNYLEHLDPHGRVETFFPPPASLGLVYRPGFNAYFSAELVY
jgi:iron complex outermembrane recepter protein